MRDEETYLFISTAIWLLLDVVLSLSLSQFLNLIFILVRTKAFSSRAH